MTIDILKQEIEIGDTVLYNPPYQKGLVIGKVINFTPKQVKIKGINGRDCTRFSSDVVKINEQIEIAKEKYPENYI